MMRMLDALRERLRKKETVSLSVKVRPQAQGTQLKGMLADGTLKIDLAAVPEGGKANDELIRFFVEECEIPRNAIEIVSGQTSRRKVVRITR